MAKGKRGKGGAGGSTSWAGGGGSAGQAQSGGRSTTFQGGKLRASGGFGRAGGSQGQGVLGTQINAAGNTVRVRKPGGDNTPVKGLPTTSGTAHLSTKGKRGGTFFDHVAPTVRPGQGRQAGGSTQ